MDKQKSIDALQFFVTGLSNGAFQHLVQSHVFKSQGYIKFGEHFADHAKEEYGWVEKFIDRILDLDGEVKVEARPVAPIVSDPVEYMTAEIDRQHKGLDILRNCMETVKDDVTTYDILKDYFKDEEQDFYDDKTILDLMKKLGIENWLMTQL
ncbi:MAG: hypothetical protein NC336_09560 [Clostridium sp.]|nr:hypothetical protein [Clostridium sp.]